MVGQFFWFEILNFNFLEERFEDFVDIFWQGVGEGSLVLISFLSIFFFFFEGGGGYLVNCILGSFCKFKVQNGNTFLLNAKIVSILEALTEDAFWS